jgi:D-glycero-alpha-D-manno-heptose-7-phosphate kinase
MSVKTRSHARVSLGSGGDTDYYLKNIGWGCIVNVTLESIYFECSIFENQKNEINYTTVLNQDDPYLIQHLLLENNSFQKVQKSIVKDQTTFLLEGEEQIVKYNDILNNTKDQSTINNLELDGGMLDLIKATITYVNPQFSKDLQIKTNIPRESGLGGSSVLNVALLLALIKDQGKLTNPEELAQAAYTIERNIMDVPGGYQDQWAAAYGRGLNYMIFKQGKVEVHPINITAQNLEKLEKNSLLVYFSRRTNTGSKVHEDQKRMIEENPKYLQKLMLEKRANAIKVKEALEKGNFTKFAKHVNKDWEIKQKLSAKISVRDEIYKTALENGALAGRLCGAGSGGTYYFYCEEGKKEKVLKSIKHLILKNLPFKIQRPTQAGAKLL